jgi:hypothetical protein
MVKVFILLELNGILWGRPFGLYFNYREWGLELCQVFMIFICFVFIGLRRIFGEWGLDRF